ncbi:MAG: trypsin-like peptidase domain-containing protein [Candidatus Marinimicrobia bacterium]|nr:trypsin-like peptidase domain-containing protein [Candidatus Neomarinimicrobiota bacterium]
MSINKYFLSVTLLFIGMSILGAQVSIGGLPYSLENTVRAQIQTVTLPEVDAAPLLLEDETAPKDEPYRFGYPQPVDLSLENSGTWEDLSDGGRLWRLQIESPGAKSINLIYNRFHLPDGGRFYVYSEDLTSVYGAFTSQNNKDHMEFSTSPTSGDVTILEYYHPTQDLGDTDISVSSVIHAYRDIFSLIDRNFGDSGACNNNVNCPEGDPWESEIRSVGMILTSGGFRICTGAMVNNVRQDLTPYFLTANHCLGGESTWIIMFNYESPTCANVDGPTNFTVQGTQLMANYSPSDFALLLLQETPPEEYNVHFAGWSAIDTAPQQPVCIHHPSGDIKKISFDYDAGISNGWSTDDGSHWQIAQWDDGTTEPGSSGSPLFDIDHRIVGQLHGGEASCSYNFNDYYGKVARSWATGGSAASRLKDWLDPDNTGAVVLDGIDMIDLPDPELAYTPEDLSVVLPSGLSETQSLSVSNTGQPGSVLYYNLLATPFENPGYGNDDFGHFWADSDDEPSLPYQWEDISGIGTQVDFVHNDQAPIDPIDIGFEFPFYGTNYTQCRINPNGWIGFGVDNTSWDNSNLPMPGSPAPAIFGFWDDLNPLNTGNNNGGGNVYYHANADRFVVWFDDVIHWPVNYDGTYNFQFVLYTDGRIQLNYSSMVGDIDSGTIGIQNEDGTDGVQVVYNANYIHSALSVEFKTEPAWITIDPAPGYDGALEMGQTAVHPVIFDAADQLPGTYLSNIILSSNAGSISLPVEMVVNPAGILGDLNQDDAINVQDIILCVSIIIGNTDPTSYQLWAGDMNGDGALNILDVITIVNIIIG